MLTYSLRPTETRWSTVTPDTNERGKCSAIDAGERVKTKRPATRPAAPREKAKSNFFSPFCHRLGAQG